MKRKIALTIALSLLLCGGQTFAADRDSVKQTGEYYSGSVYGPSLSSWELDAVADAVAAFLNEYIVDGMTEQQKVRAACDYLMDTCSYAVSWAENGANTAWGALVYHEAQCSGYARAFKALCDGMGIGCYYVHADENSINPSHQWNVVSVDGNWYIIDVQGFDSSNELISPEDLNFNYTVFYLVSDEKYASMGLSWDRSSVPACLSSYYGDPFESPREYDAYLNDAVDYVYSGTQDIIINGSALTVKTYNIDGYNYIKLRDIAAMVNGTEDQFNVVWSQDTAILWVDTKTPYSYVGGELETGSEKGVLNPTSASSFRVDGAEATPECYNIRNNNYYKLRDIGELIGFDVDWDGTHAVIETE